MKINMKRVKKKNEILIHFSYYASLNGLKILPTQKLFLEPTWGMRK